MARPKPKPENEPKRKTVSLPAALKLAADRYIDREHIVGGDNFSQLVATALCNYISGKYPSMILDAKLDIRKQHAATPTALETVETTPAGAGARKSKRGAT